MKSSAYVHAMNTPNEKIATRVLACRPYRFPMLCGRLTAPIRLTKGTIAMMMKHRMNQGMAVSTGLSHHTGRFATCRSRSSLT